MGRGTACVARVPCALPREKGGRVSYDNSAPDPGGPRPGAPDPGSSPGQDPQDLPPPAPFHGQLPPYPGPPASPGKPFAGGYGGYGGYGIGPAGSPPPTYLGWAIAAAVGGVFFSLILGFPCALLATRYARRVRPAWDTGNQAEAARCSRLALSWSIAATVLDVVGVALFAYVISHNGTVPA
jgi:hypothetical protein